jgi:ATP-binding cassette, subfamily B (MDR/TAP), member 1
MSEIEKGSRVPTADAPPVDTSESDSNNDDFEQRLAGLPERYRDEILRQYDIPQTEVSLLAVLRHATWFEKVLMIVGSIMSVATGFSFSEGVDITGAALPLMTVIFGNLTNVFGGFGSPGSGTVDNIPSVSVLNSKVAHFALQFVYLGFGVLIASFLGTFFWTLSGERISRRIRG